MDFGILPPEVNSGRMYSGPGAGPLLATAAAWRGLAAELGLAASCYESVITELATGWTGPSATAMAAAATPYVGWLHGAAALAEQTAAQAHAAAVAFEEAFALTVPPPVVAANRSQLVALITTNLFGQNTPAIAATEAAYAVMWAQDATAMYGYAGAAAGATVLPPVTPPPETTNPAGPADQLLAVGRTAGSTLATKTQQALGKLSSTTQGVASPAADPTAPLSASPGGLPPPLAELPASSIIELSLIPIHLGAGLFGAVVIDGLGVFAIDAPGAVGSMLLKEIAAAGGVPYVLAEAASPGAAAASAGMGQAIPVSGLSVPTAWTTTAGETQPVVTARPAGAAAPAGVVRHSVNEMAMAGTAGLSATAGLNGGRPAAKPATARRGRPPQPPSGARPEIAAELRELIGLHDAGLLNAREFAEEKRRLFAEAEAAT